MQPQGTKFFTGYLSAETLQLSLSDNVIAITIKVTTGTVEVTGSAQLKGVASVAIALSSGDTITLTGTDANSPIDSLFIDATSGACNLITQQ